VPAKNYQVATYLTSAAEFKQLPEDKGVEVAFSGCSNAGKSSTMNALTNNKTLARTSKTPGRTQLINLFSLDDDRRIVDLPGFGYAKVPDRIKAKWQTNIDLYLRERDCLQGIVLVSDMRHPLKTFECDMMAWASMSGMPMLVLLNKMDKLSKGAAASTVQKVRNHVKTLDGNITVLPFSAMKKEGLPEVLEVLDDWFAF